MNEECERILRQYIEGAINHRIASEIGDYESGNMHHDSIIAALSGLRKMGDSGVAALTSALQHKDAGVRLWSATHLLEYRRELAELELKRLSGCRDCVGMDARTVLREWEQGTLKLPPFSQ